MWLVAIPAIAILAVFALVMYGVGDGDEDSDAAAPASWTFMVYVMGDTDLEPYALDDLTEMASVGSSEDLSIVAMVDRSPDYSDEGVLNLDDWEDTKLLEVQEDELVEVADLGELNTGSSDTLASFIETAVPLYPADNYALLLWDHGGGWVGMGADQTDGEDGLELNEISEGIDAGLASTGVERLDLLGFDACLMATFEVASTLAPYADYMVASEEVEPGHGWNYEELAIVSEDPDIAAPDLAMAMIDGYALQAEDEGTESDITLGLLDLTAVDDLEAAMSEVATAFVADPIAFSPDVASAQHDVLEFGRDPDPTSSTHQIDLGGFLENLAAEEGEIAALAEAATAALDAVVMEHIAGPATSASTGLSIYFPPTESLFDAGYLGLDSVPAWPTMLAQYYASGALLTQESRASFAAAVDPVVSFDDDGVSVFAAMPSAGAESVADTSVAVGFEDEDGELVYVLEMPATVMEQDGAVGVGAQYDLTYLTIGSEEDDALVYQSVGVDWGTGHTVIDIPIDYYGPGGAPEDYRDALMSIVLDDEGAIIEQDFFARDSSGSLGAFDPDPNGLLFPIALVSTGDGEWVYEQTVPEGISADLDALEFFVNEIPEGTELTFDLSVTDFGGHSDYTTVSVTAR